MKLRLMLAALMLMSTFSTYAQLKQVDYNKIVVPTSVKNVDLSEKLVQLAWQNMPDNGVLYNDVDIAKYNERKARWDWLNQFSIAGNYNEFNIEGSERSQFFPRYNVRLSMSLGIFVDQPNNKRIATKEVHNAELNVQSQKMSVRAEVLRRYQNYLFAQEILKTQTQAMEDAHSNFLLVEQKFKNGELTMYDYSKSSTLYNSEVIRKLTAEKTVKLAIIDIEELIGVSFQDLLVE